MNPYIVDFLLRFVLIVLIILLVVGLMWAVDILLLALGVI